MNKQELRDNFFKEHTYKCENGISLVCTHPHNLFEWMYKQFSLNGVVASKCKCDAPLIRTGEKNIEYCANCELDL
jgi:hypothetical protein